MFYNSFKLAAFMLRRERKTSAAWVLSMVLINFFILLLMGAMLMPDAASRLEFIAMLENPVMLAMVGPLYSMDVYTIGALYTLMMFVFMGITVGIMNIFLVVRHTRADEELGRYEVLRSLPIGRLSALGAALLTAVVVNTIMAVFFALTMWAGMHIVGAEVGFGASLLWGAGLGAVGLAFAGVAAFFGQVSSSARGALGLSFTVMGLFYFLRAGADASPASFGVLAFISPLGLMSRTWVYVGNVWWPILIIIGYALAFAALALVLCRKRDIDQGLLPSIPGRAHGGLLMKSALGLNFRLARGTIIAWVVALFITGLSYSAVLHDIENFVAGNDAYRQLILGGTGLLEEIESQGYGIDEIVAQMNAVLGTHGLSVVQLFSNMIGFFMAMMATVPMIMLIKKARTEETLYRADMIFATSTSKTSYMLGLVGMAFAVAVVMQLAHALGLYVLASQTLENPADLPLSFLLQSALVYVPALWVIGGIAVLLVGLWPRRTGVLWVYYGFVLLVMMYARMTPGLEWLQNLTPLGFVPQLPMDEINWLVMAALSIIAFMLAGAGIFCYRRRDIGVVA